MAFEDDIVVRLVAKSVPVASIFVSSKSVVPSGPTAVGPYWSLTVTSGTSPLRTQNSVAVPAYVRPGMQVFTRASTFAAAMIAARLAYDALVGVRNEFINGVYYRELNPTQEPFDVGLDGQGRAYVAFNITGVKRPT